MAASGATRLAPAVALVSTRAPVDHDHLARYTLGNRALELEVLKLFAGQAPVYLTHLRTARSDKDWRDAAHTLKGSARAVGAMFVARLAEQAEALRMTSDAAAMTTMLDSLADAIDEARAHIALLDAID